MKYSGLRTNVLSLLGITFLCGAALSGCATDVQTAAAAATGGMLGLQLGVQALTGSKLEVQIDMYSPTEEQRVAMRLDHDLAITRLLARPRSDDSGLLRDATPERIISISVRLQTVMEALGKRATALTASSAQLKEIPLTGQYAPVIATLEAQARAATTAVEAWRSFMTTLKQNVDRINDTDVLDTLASDLLTLRVRLYRVSRLDGVSSGYIDFMKVVMRAALLQDASAAGGARVANLTRDINTALQGFKDEPAATGAERIAALLDALRGPVAAVGNDRPSTDLSLKAFGLSLDSARLLTLTSKETIVSALAPSQVMRLPPERKTSPNVPGSSETPLACIGEAAVVVVRSCSAAGYDSITLALERATADINLGPIANEVQQVIQAAGRGLSAITDPRNEGQWRLNAAYAKSDGGAGNHNSVIYFENMGLPIVKSSTFDPTKFVVAQGALYRQVFSAAVAAFGAPLQSTAGTAGAADMQSSNVIATRARILNAQKAAAATREKVIDVLRTTIDQQQKIKDGKWATDKAALIKAAQDALKDAAGQLEAIAGTN